MNWVCDGSEGFVVRIELVNWGYGGSEGFVLG